MTGPWAIPDFRRFLGAQLLLTLGMQVQGLAVGWQLYALTGDVLLLGLLGLAEVVPNLACSLYAGHLADTLRRRDLVVAAALLQSCTGALLLAGSFDGWLATHAWAVFAVVGLTGLARALAGPARTALSVELVPREQYAAAVGLRSGTFQVATIAGPALGGLLYAWGGAIPAYGAACALVLAAALLFLRIRRGSRPLDGGEPVWASIRSGLAFVRGQRLVLGAMALDLFAVLFGGATALLPAFASDILLVGPVGLGWLRAAPAAGAIATSILMARHGSLRRAGPAMLLAVALFGVCMAGFALSPWFWLSLLLLALSGVCDQVSVVVRHTLVQTVTPPHLLGRVASINTIFISSSNELGAFESGLAARLLGLAPSVLFGAAMTLATVAGVAWWVPALRRLDRVEDAAPPA